MADLSKTPGDDPDGRRPAFPQDPRSRLRASDADRQAVAQMLGDAAAQGKLTFSEYDDRLKDVWAASTYGQLDVLIDDIAPTVRPVSTPVAGSDRTERAFAMMGGFERKGNWEVPARMTALVIMGGGTIDLRNATFTTGGVEIECTAIMGGIDITVTDAMSVDVHGTGIMGGFDHRKITGRPGAPRVVVTGMALMGGVGVTVKMSS